MKLSQQLQYCYSRNRRAIDPMQVSQGLMTLRYIFILYAIIRQLQFLSWINKIISFQFYMTSLDGKTLARLEQIGFYKSWDVS